MPRLFLNIFTLVIAAVALCVPRVSAFGLDTYAPQSVLSTGKWVKISVDQSGLYRIPVATLKSWGFSDPSLVRVHGYGGRRIGEVLSASTYVDDLPVTYSELTPSGLVFYAVASDSWTYSSDNYYHGELNPYTTVGYYFLTEAPAAELPTTATAGASTPVSTAMARLHHECELTMPSTAGPIAVGEDLRAQRSRAFTFATPGRAEKSVWFECQVAHRHVGASALLSFEVDGKPVSRVAADDVPSTSSSHYVHGSVTATRHTAATSGLDNVAVTVTYTPRLDPSFAALDYLSLNYTRTLAMTKDDRDRVEFWSDDSQLSFEGPADMRVWDVTAPHAVARVNTLAADGRHTWTATAPSTRHYVAWNAAASLPAPKWEGSVAAQNLHGMQATPEMVIFAEPRLQGQARRIADLHLKLDSMTVTIVDPQQVYNEFGSGSPDVGAMRRYLKMVYDRGKAAGKPLRYALLMGRPTLDHRNILESSRRSRTVTLPTWVVTSSKQSLSDNESYPGDDFIAILDDDSGSNRKTDRVSIAVGRMPARNADDATVMVDKLYRYVYKSRDGVWTNRLMMIADDGDAGEHLAQAERMIAQLEQTPGAQYTMNKVYVDAYPLLGGKCEGGRTDMYSMLDQGVAWWFFTGHANDHSWTAESILTYKDITEGLYFRNVPFVLASTCDFMRWDNPSNLSGAEIMFSHPNGGAIGMISAARPVLIPNNDMFLSAIGRHALERDDSGRLLPPAEVLRLAKNDIRDTRSNRPVADENRMRFAFMGDPAMRLVMPSNTIHIKSIGGKTPGGDEQVVIPAMAEVDIEGEILSPDGSLMGAFSGPMTFELYDAVESRLTQGRGDDGEPVAFDNMGRRLHVGSGTVQDGRFSVRLSMPSVISQNFRPATLSLFASDQATGSRAVGVTSDFYVYGATDPAVPDTVCPVIDRMVLNHDNFTDGEIVDPTPLLMASMHDNVGINVSTAGVGHQMTVTIDGTVTRSDVSTYYTPPVNPEGTGTVAYRLPAMQPGAHSLRMRVFDTSGNVCERELSFTVSDKVAPRIFEVYADANPASTSTNFYVRHDRPENIVQVKIEVFDLMGRPVWSSVQKSMSDNDLSAPVAWNLTDSNGHRVGRGIYLYRATVTADNTHFQTTSRRIAVAGEQ